MGKTVEFPATAASSSNLLYVLALLLTDPRWVPPDFEFDSDSELLSDSDFEFEDD